MGSLRIHKASIKKAGFRTLGPKEKIGKQNGGLEGYPAIGKKK